MSADVKSVKEATLAKCWAIVKTPVVGDQMGLSARTWGEIPLKTRTVLVMLGAVSNSATKDDPRTVARRPWDSLTSQDRANIGSIAREIKGDLKSAACLF